MPSALEQQQRNSATSLTDATFCFPNKAVVVVPRCIAVSNGDECQSLSSESPTADGAFPSAIHFSIESESRIIVFRLLRHLAECPPPELASTLCNLDSSLVVEALQTAHFYVPDLASIVEDSVREAFEQGARGTFEQFIELRSLGYLCSVSPSITMALFYAARIHLLGFIAAPLTKYSAALLLQATVLVSVLDIPNIRAILHQASLSGNLDGALFVTALWLSSSNQPRNSSVARDLCGPVKHALPGSWESAICHCQFISAALCADGVAVIEVTEHAASVLDTVRWLLRELQLWSPARGALLLPPSQQSSVMAMGLMSQPFTTQSQCTTQRFTQQTVSQHQTQGSFRRLL